MVTKGQAHPKFDGNKDVIAKGLHFEVSLTINNKLHILFTYLDLDTISSY